MLNGVGDWEMGYIDPGIFGMISQIGYLLVFAVVSGFMFFFQPLKNLYGKIFKREQAVAPEQTTEDADAQQPGV